MKKVALFNLGFKKNTRQKDNTKLLMTKKRKVDMYYAINNKLEKEEAWVRRDERVEIFRLLEDQKSENYSDISKTQLRIINRLFYLLSHSGATCVTANYLAEKCECSLQTVYRTVAMIKQSNQVSIGFIGSGRKGTYVFVDKIHENYVFAMQFLFHYTEEQALAECEDFVVTDIYERVMGLDKSSILYKKIKALHKIGVLNQYLSLNDIRMYRNGMLDEGELYYLLEERVNNLNKNKVKYLNNKYASMLYEYLYDLTDSILLKESLYRIIKHFMGLAKDSWNPVIDEFVNAKLSIQKMFLNMNEKMVKHSNSLVKRFDVIYNELLDKTANKVQGVQSQAVVAPSTVAKTNGFYNWLDERE